MTRIGGSKPVEPHHEGPRVPHEDALQPSRTLPKTSIPTSTARTKQEVKRAVNALKANAMTGSAIDETERYYNEDTPKKGAAVLAQVEVLKPNKE